MDSPNELRMDKTKFSVASLHDKSDEKAYWQNQTPAARLEALEFLRQVMYGYNPATDRLQRVLEVVKRTPKPARVAASARRVTGVESAENTAG